MHFSRLAGTLAAAAISTLAQAQVVRLDFTLSGTGASPEIPGFTGSTGSGYVIVDLGHGETVRGPNWLAVESSVGCYTYQDGLCTSSNNIQLPVVTDWSVTSVLGTNSKRPDLFSFSSVLQERRQVNPFNMVVIGDSAQINDLQLQQQQQPNGHVERVTHNLWMTSISPASDAPFNLLQPWLAGNQNPVSVTVENGFQSWDASYTNLSIYTSWQSFNIVSMTATVLAVPEPGSALLLTVGLLMMLPTAHRLRRGRSVRQSVQPRQ